VASPDLVITDLRLPDGDGGDVVRALRGRTTVPVVVMTAFGDQKVAVEAMRLGALDYVVKSEETFREMPHVAARALREWGHIVERHRAEEALRQSEAHHRSIIEGTLDLVCLVDAAGRIRFVSPSVQTILGYAPAELLGHAVFEFLHPDEVGEAEGLLARAVAGEEPRLATLRVGTKEGSWRTLEVIGRSRLESRPEAGLILNARDVTERLKAEEERRRLEAQLRQAQKLETLGTLAGGIAHDFNNILHAVIGCIELARSRASADPGADRYLEQSLEVARRGRDLVRQILQFSRRGEPSRRPLDLGRLAQEVVRLAKATFPSSVELRLEVQEGATVLGDPTQMHQVLMNLATNARQAMGAAGGVLEIVVAAGREVVVEVGDSGPGVPPELRERIFEPFFTTRDVGSGTGLGLSVVHGIVKDHGGSIQCETGPRGGALFRVRLPRADGSAEEPAVPRAAGAADRTRLRVLLVDDDPAVLYVGQALLEELGHSVTAAPGAEGALQAFAREPFAFDLVVVDEQMPRMPGTALVRELRRTRPDLPVIVASGQGSLLKDAHADLTGVHWLGKPFDLAELRRTVDLAVRGEGA
jgi:PAS domain S-box-containing protein